MPIRLLKDSICTSESIDQLGWFEEVMFYRLIVSVDDYGRFDARPAVLKSRLFPLKERLTSKDVFVSLQKLADAGIVRLYSVDNKPYLYLPTWESHQTIRAKKSRYPAPPECDSLVEHENICKQMQADASKCSRNPIQSVSESVSESVTHDVRTDGFDQFWAAYPKKTGKEAARKAWSKTKGTALDAILTALEAQKRSDQWHRDNGRYIPNPATWLNQGRWQDELPGAEPNRTDGPGRRELGADELEAIRQLMEG